MTESRAKPKSKRAPRSIGARKPTAKVRKTASSGRARQPAKAGAKAKPVTKVKPNASEVKPTKRAGDEKAAVVISGKNSRIAQAAAGAPPQVRAGVKGSERATAEPASRLIDRRIRDLEGWRGKTLARMRALILEADPEVTEEWKWRGTPVWTHHGIVCTGESYAKVVKLTFAQGAKVPDPSRLFNSSLEGNTRRAIDIHEGENIDAGAFKALVKAAVTQNRAPKKR
jgi:hypothetical protein